MSDIKTKEERSKNMSAIRGKDTKPEIYLRKLLFANGFRYRLYSTKIPGHPDLWMKKYNTAIFVHGCFWHRHEGCKYAYMPKSREEFWSEKFQANILRDKKVQQDLSDRNIRSLIIWECTLKKVQKKDGDPEKLVADISTFLNSEERYREI
ncbi:MAG: DNA mismatch endonuclease Vsr [Bacteroides thetaiotaomicron]|nr:DNA mismatch endonuclease Vsr [Bacteroides thetaiotaomicron]